LQDRESALYGTRRECKVFAHLEEGRDHVVFEFFNQPREREGMWKLPPRIVVTYNEDQDVYYVLSERSIDVEERGVFEVLWKGDLAPCVKEFTTMCTDMWYEEMQDRVHERSIREAVGA
jgi:hypothetical protein